MSDPDVEKAKQEILHYLMKHPEASDDLEGIARFWVTKQRIEAAVATVERAVDELVVEGRLEKKLRKTRLGKTVLVRYQVGKNPTGPS
jgi:hypothetical protein